MKTFTDYGIRTNKSSGQDRTICPACSPTRKKSGERCLSVNIDDGIWFCQHCGWSGNVSGIKTDWYKPVKIYAKPNDVRSDLPQSVRDWFKKRGISAQVLERNRIGYQDKKIVFQYLELGIVVNQKFRTGKKEFHQVSGAKKILYGLDDISSVDEFIIVEGEMDKLAIEEAGIKNCVSVPDGAPDPKSRNFASKFTFLDELDLDKYKKIIIAVDTDLPGKKLEEELIRRFGPEKCWTVDWPEDCKDANDVLIKHGTEKIISCIDNALAMPVDGIVDNDNLLRRLDSIYEQGMEKGEKTGWDNIDDYYTVKVGEFTVITGIPSHGKSEWLDALLINIARRLGWRFALFSPENYPVELHGAKLIQKFAGQHFDKRNMDPETKEYCKNWFVEHFTIFDPTEEQLNIDNLLNLARISVTRRGIKGLVLDPWNEIEHKRQSGISETEYISECLTKIRRFARKYKVHVWIVAHPTKLRKDDKGEYPVPTPYDISGSANWRNKADNCISVWRNVTDEDSAVEIHIQKVRFRNIGRAGKSDLFYDRSTGTYSEIELKNFMDI